MAYSPSSSNGLTFRYIPALDGLRAIAILAVMVYHAHPSLLPGGFVGVELFFVLSGFLITGLLLKEQQRHDRIHLGYFYARRILRLFPALALLLAAVTVFTFTALPSEFGPRTLTDSWFALFYCTNWVRAFELTGPSFLGHTWSLSIEEQFYMFWPFALILLMRRTSHDRSGHCLARLLTILAGLAMLHRVVLLFSGATAVRLYNGLDTRADGLLFGCALAAALSSGLLDLSRDRVSQFIQRATPLAIAGFTFAACTLSWTKPGTYMWGLPFVSLCTGVLICSVLRSPCGRMTRVLTSRSLVWIGQLSYGLYLWHYPVYRIMGHFGATQMQCLTLGTALTFTLATVSWYLLEKPILSLKSRFQPGQSGVPAMAPA